jgi:DNA-directed RNA polymerase specialized sigma24 family protein
MGVFQTPAGTAGGVGGALVLMGLMFWGAQMARRRARAAAAQAVVSDAFPRTTWGTLRQAAQHDPNAFQRFLNKYLPPVTQYLRALGEKEEAIQAITQKLFQRMATEAFLSQADQTKGRFRSVVIALAENARAELKGEASRFDVTTRANLMAFDKLWVANLVGQAIERVGKEQALLKGHLLDGKPLAELAGALGRSLDDVGQALQQALAEVKVSLVDLIRAYCSTQEEFEDERLYLLKLAPAGLSAR